MDKSAAVISKTQDLHEQTTVVVAHDHTMFGLAAQRIQGERAVFTNQYAPQIHKGGVDVIGLVIGGDRPRLGNGPVDPWWGSVALLDMLWQEAEESSDTLKICLSYQDIDAAAAEGKIAALLTMEGALPVQEGPFPESLVNLRMLYRLGLRSLQFLGQGWNRIFDAPASAWTGSGQTRSEGLTPFGVDVVREMNRLGMVIDLAHLPDPDPAFWDVLETSQDPIIDSHSNVRGAYDVPRNLSDERIRAIAQNNGVIGLNLTSFWVSGETERATVDDLVRHVDHIAELVGVDHVGLGPDFVKVEVVGLGPVHYIEGIEDVSKLPLVTEALVARGYCHEDIRKILGENFLRVFRRVIR
jgi:membrane dipeptidase